MPARCSKPCSAKTIPTSRRQRHRWAKRLLKDKVASLDQGNPPGRAGTTQTEAVEEALGYFVRNVERMQYGTFRKNGWFIGSGVVEAGCKTVIGARCKQSGMFWSKPGAEKMLALALHPDQPTDTTTFWKYRLNQHAKRNDSLAPRGITKNFVSHPIPPECGIYYFSSLN